MKVLAFNPGISKTDWLYDLCGEGCDAFFDYITDMHRMGPYEIQYWRTDS